MAVLEEGLRGLDVRQRLAELAIKNPGATAIQFGAEKISFQDLNRRVIEVASAVCDTKQRTKTIGVLPVLVDYTIQSVVNILACLWLRQPFSPIDADTPGVRFEFLRELLSNPLWVLVSDPLNPPHAASGMTVVDLSSSCLGAPFSPPGEETGLVVMTSGSTGRPKGVSIPWDVIDYRIDDYFESLGENTRPIVFTSFAPLNFVAGLLHVFLILHGASMVRINPKSETPRNLLTTIARSGVTHLFLPSQLFRLLSQIAPESNQPLDTCVLMSVGGESVHFENLSRFRSIVPKGTVFRHVLGATECMTFLANSFRVHDAPQEGQVPVHSGALPPGVRLVDRGDGLFEVLCRGPIASGYLPNDAPENVRFITAEDGITWWVSGDLVSWTQNNELVHRGRDDDVVKIRGKLASPSELIHQLLQWPSVTGATVLVGRHREEPYFVAHVESPEFDRLDRAGLRAHLRETLDSHLVPRKIEVWESFPLNPHGKLDRARLAKRHGID